jgi:hypothetical protein
MHASGVVVAGLVVTAAVLRAVYVAGYRAGARRVQNRVEFLEKCLTAWQDMFGRKVSNDDES